MNSDTQENQPPKKEESFFREIIKFALIALFIVLPIRLVVAQPYIISGSSMDPTFAHGQYIIVDELTYKLEDPKRGDVIIFTYPQDESKSFIKRIIGMPGETVEIHGQTVTIKNKENASGFVLDEPYVTKLGNNDLIVPELKENEYFVMGDNRPASYDSRFWGPLTKDHIIGRPLVRLLPVNKISLFPGEYHEKSTTTAPEAR